MFSQSGEGAQVLKRIELEGNDCELFIKDKAYKTVFNGLLEKTETPQPDKDTVILFDMSGNGSVADTWKKQGHFVFGASSFADKLEHDREFGFSIMQEAGIKIPKYKEFTSFEEGLKTVRATNELLVFKPSGSLPTKLTFCAKSSEELIAYMQFVEKQYGKHIKSFVLQEFIEGIVVSSEFFCMGEAGFLHPANHTVEVKKSMNDELGPSTGCSGNITWPCEVDSIIEEGVQRVEETCKNHNYIGQIDLNTVASEHGIYGLEWTPRFGYDATPTLLSSLDCDLGEFFSDIARSQFKEDLPFKEQYAGSVRVTIPPYPAEPQGRGDSDSLSPNRGIPILNYEKYEEDLYFYEVSKENDSLCHSGGTGVIACVIGISKTAEESLDVPYEILKELVVPDKQYRTDLSKVLSKAVKEANLYA